MESKNNDELIKFTNGNSHFKIDLIYIKSKKYKNKSNDEPPILDISNDCCEFLSSYFKYYTKEKYDDSNLHIYRPIPNIITNKRNLFNDNEDGDFDYEIFNLLDTKSKLFTELINISSELRLNNLYDKLSIISSYEIKLIIDQCKDEDKDENELNIKILKKQYENNNIPIPDNIDDLSLENLSTLFISKKYNIK